jgi:hypothetical protein
MEDSTSIEALRQEIEHLRSKLLEQCQPRISADLERMDVIKDYLVASSKALSEEYFVGHIRRPSNVVSAGTHQSAQEDIPSPTAPERQVALTASPRETKQSRVPLMARVMSRRSVPSMIGSLHLCPTRGQLILTRTNSYLHSETATGAIR